MKKVFNSKDESDLKIINKLLLEYETSKKINKNIIIILNEEDIHDISLTWGNRILNLTLTELYYNLTKILD